jgi:hypothetical protein
MITAPGAAAGVERDLEAAAADPLDVDERQGEDLLDVAARASASAVTAPSGPT